MVNKDSGRCIAFLGECSLQLGVRAHLRQNHLINTDTLICLHCHKHFRGGLLSFPGNLGHGTKEASCAGRRLDLVQSSRDLAVKHKLLELGEGQVAKAVVPAHELSLVINGGKVDVLVLLELRIHVEGEWPHPCVCFSSLLSFSDERLLACTVTSLLVAPSEAKGGFLRMLVGTFSSAVNSLLRWSWPGIRRTCSNW